MGYPAISPVPEVPDDEAPLSVSVAEAALLKAQELLAVIPLAAVLCDRHTTQLYLGNTAFWNLVDWPEVGESDPPLLMEYCKTPKERKRLQRRVKEGKHSQQEQFCLELKIGLTEVSIAFQPISPEHALLVFSQLTPITKSPHPSENTLPVAISAAEMDRTLSQFIEALHPAVDLKVLLNRGVQAIARHLSVTRAIVLHYSSVQKTWTVVAMAGQQEGSGCIFPPIFADPGDRLQARLSTTPISLESLSLSELGLPIDGGRGEWLVGLPDSPDEAGGTALWGALYVQTQRNRELPRDLLHTMALHLAIAIQEAEVCRQLYRRIAELERQVQAHSAQLELAADFEATLKRITDKVRDSLDEHQILQTAVQELAIALGVQSCNAALYDLERGTSTIRYEHITLGVPFEGHVADMQAFPEIYGQLLNGLCFQFCSIFPNPVRGRVAMFACPIQDDLGVLGDLWLITQQYSTFRDQDLRLVELVSNQCAIALRQSRLFQAAQAQVMQLERLNRLKDDFLSTVSHELRTPMASIKMAIQMLGINLERMGCLESGTPIHRYFEILNTQCQRETNLINDLLDLSQLETDPKPLQRTALDLNLWFPQLVQPFAERAKTAGQQFDLLLAAKLPPLNTDLRILERIVSELLDNACKYTPADGAIAVRVQPLLGADYHPVEVEISIVNVGVEIPIGELPHIFDKFYRLPNENPWQHSGTGLGLALVQKLTRRLGGSLAVNSRMQQTCFTLSIPVL
ncbi:MULTISPECIES: GAF domain-containing sensor histidine kinase [unclassified Leptolyngbya]|uniref:sensor histidine kinase n=1 Tax=unclassified Leptolyngbya TaxID=2650499 RepID=UPI0016835204|nr:MULTISPECIES: GAF domain-containing sensor histidine kinase [unclassified Leptolyngbya]MBD1913600.1 GAF domain-containing sensor histidine kinase [Leptolyngbya sp. FACHB-8]MBD2154069.1 GAF domain-containing sensor histidine kinase [Leptolyngbya sp. FACHB-16]